MVASRYRHALYLGLSVAPVVLFVSLGGACGANVDDLFQSSGGVGGSGSSGKGATTTSGNGVTVTTSTGGPATTGPTTTSGPGGQTVSSSQASTSSGFFPPTVDCGLAQPCEIQSGGCCYNAQSQQSTCSIGGNCPGSATQIECQVPSDCNSGICCAIRNNSQSPYAVVQCDTQCDLPSRFLCDHLNPVCPPYIDGQGNTIPTTCKASTLLPLGYYICSF